MRGCSNHLALLPGLALLQNFFKLLYADILRGAPFLDRFHERLFDHQFFNNSASFIIGGILIELIPSLHVSGVVCVRRNHASRHELIKVVAHPLKIFWVPQGYQYR